MGAVYPVSDQTGHLSHPGQAHHKHELQHNQQHTSVQTPSIELVKLFDCVYIVSKNVNMVTKQSFIDLYKFLMENRFKVNHGQKIYNNSLINLSKVGL